MLFLVRLLMRFLVRLGSRHYIVRRIVMVVSCIQWLRRRTSQANHVVHLRPGETLSMQVVQEGARAHE